MGNKQEKPDQREHCRCHGSIAKYRCSVFASYGIEMNIKGVKGYEILTPYFRSSTGPFKENEQWGDIYQYVACEKCINNDVYPYFTYIAEGWEQNPKNFIEYERPNITKIKIP